MWLGCEILQVGWQASFNALSFAPFDLEMRLLEPQIEQ